MADPFTTITVAGRDVRITNPDKVFFPALGVTKLGLVQYWLDVADGALTGSRDRPTLLKRHPDGVDGFFFYQKRVPASRPDWISTVTVRFPSGRSAEFLAMRDAAHLAWVVNLGCLELHPWNVRTDDTEHPDEIRFDLDPTPEFGWADVRETALLVRETLSDFGLRAFPKTSGKRGMHVLMRIEPVWGFGDIRRAALALGREVERRAPGLATTSWWKEERRGVFVDYNQNARDRTLAAAYSVRPTPDGRVSTPLAWDEVADSDPAAFTIQTVPQRFAAIGDPSGAIDDVAYSIEPLLELADTQEADGMPEAPWPPHFPKADREPTRVQPSRARERRASGENR